MKRIVVNSPGDSESKRRRLGTLFRPNKKYVPPKWSIVPATDTPSPNHDSVQQPLTVKKSPQTQIRVIKNLRLYGHRYRENGVPIPRSASLAEYKHLIYLRKRMLSKVDGMQVEDAKQLIASHNLDCRITHELYDHDKRKINHVPYLFSEEIRPNRVSIKVVYIRKIIDGNPVDIGYVYGKGLYC